jgi:predicted dehydrogenase
MKTIKTAIVGCGNIANTYAQQISNYPSIEVTGYSDLMPERASELAGKFGGRAYESLDHVLADPEVEVVVNLTIHHAHVEVITRCLEAGKHVYSEKPLATSLAEATALVELAESKNLRLGSAPSTFLGEPAQTVASGLRAGQTGTLRALYAEINHGRIESWHPNPVPFYEVGPVWDVAVYPLGVWAALCGPMRRVTAVGKTLLADRQTKEGTPFHITSPDFVVALIEFESGAVGRLTTNFYVKPSRQGASMEFHGDAGSFFLGSSYLFNAEVEFASFGGSFSPVPLVRPGFDGVEFARGIQDFSEAIIEGRPHRCDAKIARHIIEVIEAIHHSARSEAPVEILSDFTPPCPMPWAENMP